METIIWIIPHLSPSLATLPPSASPSPYTLSPLPPPSLTCAPVAVDPVPPSDPTAPPPLPSRDIAVPALTHAVVWTPPLFEIIALARAIR
jgi:hypothetical protein